MKTIALLNQKGGVAKTTTSINLAYGLSKKHKVILIDLDPQANSTTHFVKLDSFEKSVKDCFSDSKQTKECIIKNVKPNLDLIPSDLSFTNSEMEIRMDITKRQDNRLVLVLKEIEKDYDYCIIDCPPTLSLITANVIIADPVLIIPIKPSLDALSGFLNTYNNIEATNRGYGTNVNYKILLTMINRNNTDKEFIEELENQPQIKTNILKTRIRYQASPIEKAKKANSFVIDSKDNIGLDYRDLLNEVSRLGGK